MNRDRGRRSGPVRVRLRRGNRKAAGKASNLVNAMEPSGSVAVLHPEEPAFFNPEMLETLCRRIGETRAEAEVARALQRISTTLSALGTLAEVGNQPLMTATLRSLIRDADLIGMATLARVARNVLSCLEMDDRLSYSATLARLARVGDRSMHAVWELEDLSG